MSANKKMKYSLRSSDRLNPRKSFDRYGDDLCEEILQYLSFSEKIRFECVSKQFKRCVYQRQYVFKTHCVYKPNNPRNTLPVNHLYEYPKRIANESQNTARITNFERVLKKCTKINCIDLEITKNSKLDDVMRIITDNCNDLKKISVFGSNSLRIEKSNVLNDFGIKFGNTLQNISVGNQIDEEFYSLLKFCPNVVSLSNIHVKHLIRSDVSLLKLSEVKYITGKRKSMEKFFKKYRNQLKVFSNDYDGDNCVELMSQLLQLTNLKKLSLFTESVNLFDLTNGLKNLAVNCKLTHLHLQFELENNKESCTELLAAINRFTHLKSLKIKTMNTTTESVELIKNCSQLNDLAVNNIYGDGFFKDIDKIFPKLTKMIIHCSTITDETFNYFSNLEHLRVVDVTTRRDCLVTHTAICNVIEKCKNLREFSFYECPQITVKTIQVLIDIAVNRPHIKFDHFFGDCSPKYHKLISSSVKRYSLPSNLKVSYRYDNGVEEKTIKYPPDSNSDLSHYYCPIF